MYPSGYSSTLLRNRSTINSISFRYSYGIVLLFLPSLRLSLDIHTSSEDEASSPSPPASSTYDDAIDDSLKESMISDELLESLHEAFRNKVRLLPNCTKVNYEAHFNKLPPDEDTLLLPFSKSTSRRS
jgi:hypothetical protein